jgi:hypothetical protein
MRVELEQKSSLKTLQGRVENHGSPLQGALVEVFLNDEHTPNEHDEKREPKRDLIENKNLGIPHRKLGEQVSDHA